MKKFIVLNVKENTYESWEDENAGDIAYTLNCVSDSFVGLAPQYQVIELTDDVRGSIVNLYPVKENA